MITVEIAKDGERAALIEVDVAEIDGGESEQELLTEISSALHEIRHQTARPQLSDISGTAPNWERALQDAVQTVVDADDALQAARASGNHSSINRWLPAEQAVAHARQLLALCEDKTLAPENEPLLEALRAVVDADDALEAAWASGNHSSITRWLPSEEALAKARATLSVQTADAELTTASL